VVTADGMLRRVTADAEPDLFWASRGAGANFGVVTAIEVDLFPVARLLGGGLYLRDALFAAMRPWATGMNYLNFMGVENTRTQVVRTAYRPGDFARLAELKARYDPANTFRINLNIPPPQRNLDGKTESSASLP
jgi:FAD/FMN-containing dehydrogenase